MFKAGDPGSLARGVNGHRRPGPGPTRPCRGTTAAFAPSDRRRHMSAPWRPRARRLATLAGITLATLALGPRPLAAQPVLEVGQKLPDHVEPGEVVPVEVVIRNVGKDVAEGVLVSDVLPPGSALRQATPPPKQLDEKLTWSVARLAPGQQYVLNLDLEATPGTAQGPLRHAVEVLYQGRAAGVGVSPVKAPQLSLDVSC